jgi:hypothetical protein
MYSLYLACPIGSYNKASILFDNRVEAILVARIPYALTAIPFPTAASEVVTLEFVPDMMD